MKKITVIPNKIKDVGYENTKKLIALLEKYDCETEIIYDSNEGPYIDSVSDLYIVLGGDGSIMRAAHGAVRRDIPILGVNLGRVGYMAEIEPTELGLLDNYFKGIYTVEERMMLEITAPDGSVHNALNDAVISNGSISKMISLALISSDKSLVNYRADGLIIATPTGSTAYSLAAGGPIVDPSLKCMLVTPVCSHSLTSKPLIFNDNCVLEIRNDNDSATPVYLAVDGAQNLKIESGQTVRVKRSDKATKLLKLKQESFYEKLAKKMN